MDNILYYGDNLDVLRQHIATESVDLVYLDPPFKSNQNYNILFKEQDGSRAASQIRAFEDTWTWNQEDEVVFADLVTAGGRVADVMQAFRTFLGPCDMLAYLVMMAPRLIELRRVLKPTGSIYLHCDPTASHYLKLLMDAVIGAGNFRNEIIWLRSTDTGSSKAIAKRFPTNGDTILFYSKSDSFLFMQSYIEYSNEYLERFKYKDEKGQYRWQCLKTYSKETLDRLTNENRVRWGDNAKYPEYKQYEWELKGVLISNIWTDINQINPMAKERLGYPTQKPEALLERIIKASSNEGDVVLDPFCGCGTTIAVAQKLNRQWIGIDITHLAITLIKSRLMEAFSGMAHYKVLGEPVSIPDAAELAASDPYQFQWWALGLVGARPVEQKKGADKGIDGKIIFQGEETGKFESVILSVKAGHTNVAHVRDLRGVVERENAPIGVLISMDDHSGPMKTEAVTAGFYESSSWGRKYPKIQLFTIAELLAGKQIDMPPIRQVGMTFKKAPKASSQKVENMKLEFPEDSK